MNVSVWNAALSGDLLVRAAFARITGQEPNLVGYWTLDATSDDLSPNDNPASIIGPVTFQYCLECVWAEATNAYSFCQIANMPDPNAPAMSVSLSREVAVLAGAPALAFAIMADQDVPTFPAGAQVRLVDPGGQVYDQDQNTDSVFSVTSSGQLWGLMVVNPTSGTWRVTVTAPATGAFHLTMNTVPSADVVTTSRTALDPLFDAMHPRSAKLAARSLGGFWDIVAGVAVAAVVGVVAAGAAIILAAATPVVAVAVGIGAFAIVSYSLAAAALSAIAGSNSLAGSTGQVVGMAGFVVAADSFLLMDANVDADEATQRIYRQRLKKLYPAVTASTFNRVQSQLVAAQMTLANVEAAMTGFTSGYVTACGHGLPSYLTGWYVAGNMGPLQEVVATFGPARFTPQQAQGKIIHFFACNCGSMGTAASPGLGRALVAGGAVAFFGYNLPFIINIAESPLFCSCDIAIDLAMIGGSTCVDAYNQSIAAYNQGIARLLANGNTEAAAQLEANRDALVSPTTNAVYGRADARLRIT
jgi:hypothetical protein